ncbi:MAG TPA: DinB family protein [Bryobacteraceae bacterium]|nr:DinB family protein [Bryobacteraceae bacterium]
MFRALRRNALVGWALAGCESVIVREEGNSRILVRVSETPPSKVRNPTEPWLRGHIRHRCSIIAQVLDSFDQAQEDLEYFTAPLADEEMWVEPDGLASTGFHIRHIAGSVDRLVTYLKGDALTSAQMAELSREKAGGAARVELLDALRTGFAAAAKVLEKLDPLTFDQPRTVGRRHLPTTVGGLTVHIAEHTQRHTGQAIVTAKVVAARRRA